MEKELIRRASHNHHHFMEDNSKVYYYIKQTTRTTRYSALIKPYQEKKNGRDTFLTLFFQYAGENKSQKLLKYIFEILNNQHCLVQGTFTLYNFITDPCNL